MVNRMDLSILIVNYNTADLTLQCLRSVFESKGNYSFEVILIDNASSDHSVERIEQQYPQVKLICNTENAGFAAANNQGIAQAQGKYILLLNSDTVVKEDTFDTMLSFMEANPEVGASGCKIVLPDGSLDKACKRGFPTPSAAFFYAFGISKLFPNKPYFNQYHMSHLDSDQEYPIDCLVGAFMLVRKAAIDQVGGLDETFFMYGEDIDWCYRIKQAGWEIYYYPRTEIIHHKGGSSRNKPVKIIYEFHRAMILFHRKHYRTKYPFYINGLVYMGVGLKFVMSFVKNKLL